MPENKDATIEVRVVIWNILGARGFPIESGGPIVFQEPSPGLIEAMAAFILKSKADVVVIQEAPPEEYVHALAHLLGMSAVFFPAQAKSGPEWPFGFPGAVLSHYPMEDVVPWAGVGMGLGHDLFQRHWGEVTLRIHGHPLRIGSLHLCADWGGVNREATRLAEIEAVLKSSRAEVLGGDFNMVPRSAPWKRLQEHGWRDAWLEAAVSGEGWTSDTRRPVRRIDYAWIAPGSSWGCREADVLTGLAVEVDGQPVWLSDHLPLMVTLVLLPVSHGSSD